MPAAGAGPIICVVGSANVDLTFCTPRLPRLGETVPGTAFRVGFGGKGANQAVMAARLGGRVRLIARLGRDEFGDRVLKNLRDQHIDTQYVATDPDRPTGVAAVLVDAAATNCIVVVAGANAAVSAADARAAARALQGAAVIIAQCETPVEATLEAFRVGRAAGAVTVLNPAPAVALPDELLQLTDYCVPNESELEALTGREAQSLAEVEAAVETLRQRGTRVVLVTLGERGVLAVTGEGAAHWLPPRVAAVDPTGAGDAFIGSLAVSLGEGRQLSEAVQRAQVAAALSVTRPGAQESFPSADEVERFLRGPSV